ncbi:MAG: tyrosine--tRNA ligase [bacterium]|nr:tyrosine--tRNA ligase [bacterium]
MNELEIIKRGTIDILLVDELKKKLVTKRKLRVKFGADPTAGDIHLGHAVPLEKLRQFQELGHEVIFIIGDFTAMIGDPTGRSILRKPLTRDEVMRNAETYTNQVFKILDKNKTEVVYNSKWLNDLGIEGILNLAGKYTVARMLERDDFNKRYKANTPISIIEFLYPLIQGYDSVYLKSDIEVGGNDQRFNLLVGRELQKHYGQEPQVVLTVPLLEGLDGEKKMSKSYGNYIGINEDPKEIFGKIMSISDKLMMRYYELLTTKNLSEDIHPKTLKENLAMELIEKFYDPLAAIHAKEEFLNVFKKHELPEDIPEFKFSEDSLWIQEILIRTKLVNSKGEARRMIVQAAVKVNQAKISDVKANIKIGSQAVIQVGKRKFARVSRSE